MTGEARWRHFSQHAFGWMQRLGPRRGWWARHVFHYTDVTNAATVLDGGELLSRQEATRRGVMRNDNASAKVINQTRPELLDYVRLYFRPLTATQWRNEGIRPLDPEFEAHCPVPIFFCLDLPSVLSLPGACFSNGTMASDYSDHSDSLSFFDSIPWGDVYSSGVIHDPNARRSVTARRMAEVLVPRSLKIPECIKMVACRTHAERQTLLSLVNQRHRAAWTPFVRVAPADVFFRRWACVEQVTCGEEAIVFNIHRGNWPTPIPAHFEHRDLLSRPRTWDGAISHPHLPIDARSLEDGEITLTLDGHLAYKGPYESGEAPF